MIHRRWLHEYVYSFMIKPKYMISYAHNYSLFKVLVRKFNWKKSKPHSVVAWGGAPRRWGGGGSAVAAAQRDCDLTEGIL